MSYVDVLFSFMHDQVKGYLGNPNIKYSHLESEKSIYLTHWMAMILVANSDFRIAVKIHYNDTDMITLAKSVLLMDDVVPILSKNKNSSSCIQDFTKEFANLLGGTIKRSLDLCDLNNGLSLPLLVRGFDDLFSQPSNRSETHCRVFSEKGKKFIIQIYVEFLNSQAKETLEKQTLKDPNSGSGEFEFL